jgi:putative PEP-CTERM system histidine kinase
MNIGAIGHFGALAAYLILTTLLAISWRNRSIAKLLILASGLTALWAGLFLATSVTTIPLPLLQLAELGRDASWCFFLLRILEQRARDSGLGTARLKRWRQLLLLLTAGTGALFLTRLFLPALDLPRPLRVELPLAAWLVLAITGLLLIEQIYRNGNRDERWAVKHLCLGLGVLFAYDFFMFSEALLFKKVNPDLWNARGFIDALVVPLIAISAARNESWSSGIHVSRHVVFHSLTLLAAGIYLLVMATAGFFIRYYGGSWGGVLQVAFLVGTGLLLAMLLFSDTLRAKMRVLLSKHFFSYKYDYREEWARFTRTLSRGDENVPERAIRALSALVHSNGGLLWLKTGKERYELAGQWGMEPPENLGHLSAADPLVQFLAASGWILDLDEYQESPSLYEELDLPSWATTLADAWLFVPLQFHDELMGFILIRHSNVQKSINWEDRDLLKMAGQQAAAHLAPTRPIWH